MKASSRTEALASACLQLRGGGKSSDLIQSLSTAFQWKQRGRSRPGCHSLISGASPFAALIEALQVFVLSEETPILPFNPMDTGGAAIPPPHRLLFGAGRCRGRNLAAGVTLLIL
jgi:hypothetical protein